MQIVSAQSGDLAGILELDFLVLGDRSRREFLSASIQAGSCYVSRFGGEVVAVAVFERGSFYGHGFIPLVVVHPDHRRTGVATVLIRHVESICLMENAEKLFTSTNTSNLAMQALLEKLGFERSGYIENLDRDDPELVYFKSLESNKE